MRNGDHKRGKFKRKEKRDFREMAGEGAL